MTAAGVLLGSTPEVDAHAPDPGQAVQSQIGCAAVGLATQEVTAIGEIICEMVIRAVRLDVQSGCGGEEDRSGQDHAATS